MYFIFTVKLLATRNRAVLRRISLSRDEIKSKICYGKTTEMFELCRMYFNLNQNHVK